MRNERGLSLSGLIVVLAVLGFFGLLAAKLMPAYLEYFQVKKIFAAMEQNGDTKGNVRDIRAAYDRRNAIEDVRSVHGEDLEVTKQGGDTIVTATWSVKVPIMYNASACLDFNVTTAK